MSAPPLKQRYSLMLDPQILTVLKDITRHDGISVSEQIRRGIALWLKTKGVKLESKGKTR